MSNNNIDKNMCITCAFDSRAMLYFFCKLPESQNLKAPAWNTGHKGKTEKHKAARIDDMKNTERTGWSPKVAAVVAAGFPEQTRLKKNRFDQQSGI